MRIRIILVALLLLIIAGSAFWIGGRVLSPRLVGHEPADGGQTAAFGPIQLTFDRVMDQASVQAALQIQPALPGKWTWDGQTARFTPTQSLQPGLRYTASLGTGARSAQGTPLGAAAQWTFQARPAWVAYLSPAGGPGEVWRIDPAGGKAEQVTSTGGNVVGFGASNPGGSIVYAVRSPKGGSDLWVIDRDGKNAHTLVTCAPDRCLNPTWSPDGSRIAFERAANGVSPRIWTVDARAGQSAPLFQDANVHGQDPAWSPDGSHLAFYDLGARGIRLIDLTTSAQTLIDTRQEAIPTWTPDGKHLVYDELHPGVESPANQVLAYDVSAGKAAQAAPLLGVETDAPDYGLPAWSPDGKWIAVGIRDLQGTSARQLWLLDGDGSQVSPITTDPLSNAASPRWNPWGTALIFQRFELGDSAARPDIVFWDRSTQAARVLAENASNPTWLP